MASQHQIRPVLTLHIVGGPEAGREIVIKETEAVLGRAPGSGVSIADNLLSRRHVRIYWENGAWQIEDLHSTNGTWIGGRHLTAPCPAPLKTPIRVGKTLFELSTPEAERETARLDESLIAIRVQPTAVNALTVTCEAPAERLRREQQKLASIYKVQGLLSSPVEWGEMYYLLLEVITDVVKVDDAYLLLLDQTNDLLVPVAQVSGGHRIAEISGQRLSRSIVSYVRERNEAILSSNPSQDDRFGAQSQVRIRLQSVMCVPMLAQQKLCGLFYLVSASATDAFCEDEVKLVAAIAQAAGLAIENRRLMERNIQSERMAAIGMTAAGLSHYVKNILTGLEGSVSLLRMGIDGDDKELMNDAWDILSKNHKRLSALMLDLLSLAREDKIDLAIYNVTEIVTETVDLLTPQMQADKIELEFTGRKAEPIFAEIDSRGFHRALLNLLNNATDAVLERYGSSGGGWIRVELRIDPNVQAFFLTVSDNGTGLPEPAQQQVFDGFRASRGERGTGLGMAVTKRIVEAHRGAILLESAPERGSAFTLRIPLHQQVNMTEMLTRNWLA